jgi:hypothetical protein
MVRETGEVSMLLATAPPLAKFHSWRATPSDDLLLACRELSSRALKLYKHCTGFRKWLETAGPIKLLGARLWVQENNCGRNLGAKPCGSFVSIQ